MLDTLKKYKNTLIILGVIIAVFVAYSIFFGGTTSSNLNLLVSSGCARGVAWRQRATLVVGKPPGHYARHIYL